MLAGIVVVVVVAAVVVVLSGWSAQLCALWLLQSVACGSSGYGRGGGLFGSGGIPSGGLPGGAPAGQVRSGARDRARDFSRARVAGSPRMCG